MSQIFDLFLSHLDDWLNAGNFVEGVIIVVLVFEVKRLRNEVKELRKKI